MSGNVPDGESASRPRQSRRIPWRPLLLALFAAGAYGLAFPCACPGAAFPKAHGWSFALLAVLSLAALFSLPRLLPPKKAIWWAFASVFLGRAATLHWLTGVSVLGWLVLSAVCALFVLPAIRYASVHAPPASSHGPFRWVWQTALLYTAGEALLAFLVGGFPWNRVATAVAQCLPVAQLAELGGAPLLTALAALAAAALAALCVSSGQAPRRRWAAALHLLVVPVAIALGCLLLHRAEDRLAAPAYAADTLRATLVQTSIPQPDKWDSAKIELIYGRLEQLTRAAFADTNAPAPDLLVWPEAALPDEALYSPRSYAFITNLLRRAPSSAPLLTGSLDIKLGATTNDYRYTNAALLLTPDGIPLGNYAKRKLVIVGEYLPILRWLPTRLQEQLAIRFGLPLSLAPGHATGRFRLAGRDWFLAPLICFEDIFPGLARADVAEGAALLVNLTNDAWFDDYAAPRQHALNASLRAIETRRPLLRCANTGITCHIDPTGRFAAILAAPETHSPGLLPVAVPIPAAPPRTLFLRAGWLLDPLLALFAVLQLLVLALRRYRPRRRS